MIKISDSDPEMMQKELEFQDYSLSIGPSKFFFFNSMKFSVTFHKIKAPEIEKKIPILASFSI